MELDSWDVEVRNDGALLVRVHSADRHGQPLPDAVFAFRPGDPQYEYWETQWQQRTTPVVRGPRTNGRAVLRSRLDS
jgi:hypothetical protein